MKNYISILLILILKLNNILSDEVRDCSFDGLVATCAEKEGVECEISGLLAYPKCSNGFSGVGPVCWQSCPSRFDDHGAYCGKPSAYGRGVGYGWFFNNPMANCEKEQGVGNCEWWGAVVYPKCAEGFYAFACCIWYVFFILLIVKGIKVFFV